MQQADSIFVSGHRGLVGSAIVRALHSGGYDNLMLRTRDELDLTDSAAVSLFFKAEKPAYVFMAGARVGGIRANSTYPANFIRDNLAIQLNVIDSAFEAGVRKLLFLGSSCIYPKMAPQPIREESLLTGPLEPTNEAYAIAKIAGIKLCQAYHAQHGSRFISAMPTNLYGPGDNFHPENSHVLPALIRRFSEAKEERAPSVSVWGSGNPRREFLFVDDLASACLLLMREYESPEIINVGCGEDVTIRELAKVVADVVGYSGDIVFDPSKPDGTPRKLLDVSRIERLGWGPRVSLRDGIATTYKWYKTRGHGVVRAA
jgi:GDP-L-fucose synthase